MPKIEPEFGGTAVSPPTGNLCFFAGLFGPPEELEGEGRLKPPQSLPQVLA